MTFRKINKNIKSTYRLFIRHLKYYTAETALIGACFGFRKYTGVVISLLYGLPFIIFLTTFFLIRHQNISYDIWTIAIVYLAATWSFIGPLLIWRYQHIDIKRYFYHCRLIFKSRVDFNTDFRAAITVTGI